MYSAKTIQKPSGKQQGKRAGSPGNIPRHQSCKPLQYSHWAAHYKAADDVTTEMYSPQTISSGGYRCEGHELVVNQTHTNNITWRKAGLHIIQSHVVILLLRITNLRLLYIINCLYLSNTNNSYSQLYNKESRILVTSLIRLHTLVKLCIWDHGQVKA
jgi:hypothetical protein